MIRSPSWLCTCMCVYMYVYVYMCAHTCVRDLCKIANEDRCMNTCNIYTYIYMYVYIHIYRHMLCTYTCVLQYVARWLQCGRVFLTRFSAPKLLFDCTGGPSVACSTAKAIEWDAAWKQVRCIPHSMYSTFHVFHIR